MKNFTVTIQFFQKKNFKFASKVTLEVTSDKSLIRAYPITINISQQEQKSQSLSCCFESNGVLVCT